MSGQNHSTQDSSGILRSHDRGGGGGGGGNWGAVRKGGVKAAGKKRKMTTNNHDKGKFACQVWPSASRYGGEGACEGLRRGRRA